MAKYTVLFYEEDDGPDVGYSATVAEIPSCFAAGKTKEETKRKIVDAIRESLAFHHKDDKEYFPAFVQAYEVEVD